MELLLISLWIKTSCAIFVYLSSAATGYVKLVILKTILFFSINFKSEEDALAKTLIKQPVCIHYKKLEAETTDRKLVKWLLNRESIIITLNGMVLKRLTHFTF